MIKVEYKEWACLECGKVYKTTPWKCRTFCDNTCQAVFRKKERIKLWLDDGVDWKNNRRVPDWARETIENRDGDGCLVCGISEWNGKSIVLEAEHKDGDSTNNKLENLCLVCPNCHSQTDTYKGRNKGSGRHHRRVRYAANKSF